MSIIEMRVHIDCAGCESKVKHALQNLKGVDNVDIEMGMQKVTVTGWADQKKVLKTVRRTGRRAELWQHLPYTNINSGHHHGHGHGHGQANHYYNQHQPNASSTYYASQPSSSYNYYKHGSDNNDHGYYHHPLHYSSSSAVFDRQTGSFFSDDNPTGCSVM